MTGRIKRGSASGGTGVTKLELDAEEEQARAFRRMGHLRGPNGKPLELLPSRQVEKLRHARQTGLATALVAGESEV